MHHCTISTIKWLVAQYSGHIRVIKILKQFIGSRRDYGPQSHASVNFFNRQKSQVVHHADKVTEMFVSVVCCCESKSLNLSPRALREMVKTSLVLYVTAKHYYHSMQKSCSFLTVSKYER